jgi:hypothetical protein
MTRWDLMAWAAGALIWWLVSPQPSRWRKALGGVAFGAVLVWWMRLMFAAF